MNLYNAYSNAIDMLELRGFRREKNQGRILPGENFENIQKAIDNELNDPVKWHVYVRVEGNHPSDRILFGMTDRGLAKAEADTITAFIEKERTKVGGKLHIVFVYGGDLQSTAKTQLATYSPPKISRAEAANYTNPILELFHALRLQFNPLKFALQPEMRVLSDEEKESLRESLVAPIQDKTKPLDDLLPILTIEGPIATWYGAFIGDVFFFHRSLEGEQAYYRIVMPGPPKIKVFSKKESTE